MTTLSPWNKRIRSHLDSERNFTTIERILQNPADLNLDVGGAANLSPGGSAEAADDLDFYEDVNGILTISAAEARYGSNSFRLERTSAGAYMLPTAAGRVPVVPGRTYTVSMYVMPAVTRRTLRLEIEPFDSGVSMGIVKTVNKDEVDDDWVRISATIVADAGADTLGWRLTPVAAAASEQHYIDAIKTEEGNLTGYVEQLSDISNDAGLIEAGTFRGTTFETSASGDDPRVVFDAAGVRAYDAGHAETFNLDASDGSLTVAGGVIAGGTIVGATIRTANSPAARVELDSDGIRAYTDATTTTLDFDTATGNLELTGVITALNGSAIPTTTLTGLITDGQIDAIAAAKITGQLVDAQLDSIDHAKIDGLILAAQIDSLAASQITGQMTDAQLAAIAAAKITGQITTTQITDDAITTPKINAGAVTAAEIAANTITANEIAANAITTSELDALAVTAAKIAANTITASQIAAATITGNEVAANTITSGNILANTITAAEIAAGTITTTEIAAGTIVAADIAAGTITSTEIAALTIVAGNIAASTITAGKMNVSTLSAIAVDAGTITAGTFRGTIFETQAADPKVRFDGTDGFFVTDASGNKVVQLDTATGLTLLADATGTTDDDRRISWLSPLTGDEVAYADASHTDSGPARAAVAQLVAVVPASADSDNASTYLKAQNAADTRSGALFVHCAESSDVAGVTVQVDTVGSGDSRSLLNIVGSGATTSDWAFSAAGDGKVGNTNLNLTPQFDSAGTSNLVVTATTTGTAQDTGLTLTATATGDYMIWADCGMQTGTNGQMHAELRINGAVVKTSQVIDTAGVTRANVPIVWYATGVTSGHVIKVTTFRTTADGVFIGQNSTLLIQQVGP